MAFWTRKIASKRSWHFRQFDFWKVEDFLVLDMPLDERCAASPTVSGVLVVNETTARTTKGISRTHGLGVWSRFLKGLLPHANGNGLGLEFIPPEDALGMDRIDTEFNKPWRLFDIVYPLL